VNEDIIETLRRIQCSDAACGNLKIAMGVKLAIYEIERLRSERNEMQSELRKAETESSMLRVECGVLEKNAEMTYENHKRIVKELTAERDEARRQRDEARREVCKRVESASCLSDGEPTTLASDYARWCGWDCFKEDGK
jgi:predicted  nucleic acid-binding Zn-ribbon protein